MTNGVKFFDKTIKVTTLWVIPNSITPNQVTFVRLLSIPFITWFLWKESYLIGTVLFLVFMYTDAIDGAMARTRKQITDFGKIFDPITDKLLIGSVGLIVITRFANMWIIVAMVGIEALLISAGLYKRFVKNEEVEADISGKIKVILQTFGVGFLLLAPITGMEIFTAIGIYTLYLAIISALASLFIYRSI